MVIFLLWEKTYSLFYWTNVIILELHNKLYNVRTTTRFSRISPYHM
jgi:hypothetical protein